MTFETPSQHELRTMPQAFGGCAKGGGTLWKEAEERAQRFRDKEEHWHKMETDEKYRKWYLDNLKTYQENQQRGEYY